MKEPQQARRTARASRAKSIAGYSLTEACVALGIATSAAASAVPSLSNMLDARRLEGVSSQFASDLQFARVTAVARNQSIRFSLHEAAGGSCYVIHAGAAADCSCNGESPAVCESGAKPIRTVWVPTSEHVLLQGNVSSVVFDPIMGTSTPTGTFRMIGTRNEIRHVVNLMGRIRSCSSQGSLLGYRAC